MQHFVACSVFRKLPFLRSAFCSMTKWLTGILSTVTILYKCAETNNKPIHIICVVQQVCTSSIICILGPQTTKMSIITEHHSNYSAEYWTRVCGNTVICANIELGCSYNHKTCSLSAYTCSKNFNYLPKKLMTMDVKWTIYNLQVSAIQLVLQQLNLQWGE